MHPKQLIVIAGPTAVGKTAVAIDVARELGTEILSADSRQCYRELDIGVARPSPEELAAVQHHFIASHSIHDELNAAAYESYAMAIAQQVFETHDTLVVVGGTGLYLKALTEGMDPIPAVPAEIREVLIAAYEREGISWLQQQVAAEDPQFYGQGEIRNPHRLLRALEVKRATGRSILDFRTGAKAAREFAIHKVALDLPRPELYDRINRRVALMMDAGLAAEARSVYPQRHLNALQTVGYKELFDYFDGQCTLPEAVADIQTHTRHYAKRQGTWFRKDPEYQWMAPDADVVLRHLKGKKIF
ncbi:tRNA (adenosine(37)-N6)-dimethylallyltransferase MiaA [Flaviaesturariibacter amylovorans]|uniref:tRNA dimethylallyltransferase n=1 Tax=Flaviaesturariibacter amylovorans TaxID=1084520 RepID=A0ABP8GF38_9BACT